MGNYPYLKQVVACIHQKKRNPTMFEVIIIPTFFLFFHLFVLLHIALPLGDFLRNLHMRELYANFS